MTRNTPGPTARRSPGRLFDGPLVVLRRLVWAEPYISTLTLIPLFVPNRYTPVAAAMAIAFALLRWPVLGHVVRRTALDVPVALIVSGALIGALVSPVPAVSTEQLWGYLGAVVIFYLVATRRTRGNLRCYMFWLVGGPLVLATLTLGPTWSNDGLSLGLLQPFAGSGVDWTSSETLRPFSHPDTLSQPWTYQLFGRVFPAITSMDPSANGIAQLLVLAAPFALSGVLAQRRWTRLLWALGTLVLFIAIAGTGSRGGLLALGAGVLGVVAARWHRPWLAIWVLILPVALLAVGRAGLHSIPWLDIPDSSGLSRIDLWHTSFYMVEDFLFTGVGLGAWPIAYKLLYAFGESSVLSPHNMYLQTHLELGPLGLVGLLWFILAGVRTAFRPLTAEPRTCAWIRTGLAGAWLAFAVHGSFEGSFAWAWGDGNTYHGMVSPYPWLLAALSAVLALGSEQRNAQDKLDTSRAHVAAKT